jgi:glycosyltransferase involved in cell wall biosynthesis
VAKLQQGFGLATRPYILCVGTLEPRKNHLGLLVAFDIAFRDRGFPYDLVVVGKPGWGFDGFTRAMAERGMGHIVHILSHVSNAELAALYSGAFFSAYPSLYEGFGLPVLEAMACGCPVLTSNISSMPEIAGDAAMLVNPHDHAAIAAGLVTMAEDGGIRAMLVERGHRRRRAYSWAVSARRMLDTLAQLDDGVAA